MMTVQQHLQRAEEIAEKAEEVVNRFDVSAQDAIALAQLHISIAQAKQQIVPEPQPQPGFRSDGWSVV